MSDLANSLLLMKQAPALKQALENLMEAVIWDNEAEICAALEAAHVVLSSIEAVAHLAEGVQE